MNKPKYVKVILYCVILAISVWYGLAQSQPVLGAQSKASAVGRDNPFAEIPRVVQSVSPVTFQSSESEEESPELFVEIVVLKSLDAKSLIAAIERMSSKYGSISADVKSNSLIICDTKENLARIMEMLPQEEVVRVKLVHRKYRILYADIEEVEKTLKTFISGSGKLAANQRTNNILVIDFESNIKAIDDFVEEIDRITPQILVEARIYDITNRDALDLGILWRAGRRSGFGGIDPNTGERTMFRRTDPFITGTFDSAISKVSAVGSLSFGVLNEHLDIEALLIAEQEQDFAKLLANPRILVLDNKPASFKAVTEIPYQELTQEAGGNIGTTEFKEVGVTLEVTPHVTRDGMIRLEIKPAFQVHVGDVLVTTETFGATRTSPQPVVDTREAETTALVKDGQTVVIGGLRKRTVSRLVDKIPLLGDIPLLGALFRFEGEKTTDSELVVFITPHIIEHPVLSPTELRQLENSKMPTLENQTSRFERPTQDLQSPMPSLEKVRDAEKQLLLEDIKALQ